MTPVPDVHPTEDALAEFVGGPGDAGGPSPTGDPRAPARIRDHLDRCPSCREEVARLRAASEALASLAEPELPPGLHDRLVAAVRAELPTIDRREDTLQAAAATARRARARSRPRERWHRPFGWAVAAAATVVLAVAGVTQLAQHGALDLAAGGDSAQGGASDQGATTYGGNVASAPETASGAPRFQAAGNYDLGRLAEDVERRPDLRAAYQDAFDRARRTNLQSAPGPASTVPGDAGGAPSTRATAKSAQGGDDADGGSGAAGRVGGACEPPTPAGQGAFLIDADYAGTPATLVVEVGGRPPVVTMRAYARDDCTLLDTVRGPAPAP